MRQVTGLQAALDLQEADVPEISQAIAHLELMEVELVRIEGVVAGLPVGVNG